MGNEIKFHWFDMDHTLINGDCDVLWKSFVAKRGMAKEGQDPVALADKFYEDYERGELDFDAFMEFQAAEFAGRTVPEMRRLAREHFMENVLPVVYPAAKAYVEALREADARVGILTATNTVLAAPLAEYFKVDILLGTELEVVDGRFTGRYIPPYAGGEGKVEILRDFSQKVKIPASDLAYYGDSINDRNVLSFVGHAHAVNPSDDLKKLALERDWKIMDFND